MSFNNIDEIIKKGLQESDRQNEVLANLSKNRVWNAIEKPTKQKSLHWSFVTAMAASVSLFLISVFLFYTLDHKQKQLDALESSRGKPLIKLSSKIPIKNETRPNSLEDKSEEFDGHIQADVRKQFVPLLDGQNLAERADVKAIDRQLISLPMIETIGMDNISELKVSDFDQHAQTNGPVLSGPSVYKIPSATKSKKQRRLKIRIGNSSAAHNPNQSLALNLKI